MLMETWDWRSMFGLIVYKSLSVCDEHRELWVFQGCDRTMLLGQKIEERLQRLRKSARDFVSTRKG